MVSLSIRLAIIASTELYYFKVDLLVKLKISHAFLVFAVVRIKLILFFVLINFLQLVLDV
jgi:hypothetical protein